MFLLVGCIPKYTLVENKRVDIAKTYSVDPQINWNQMVFPEGNQVLWTVNGSNLDRLLFLSHVKDGGPLFQDQKKDKYPSYKKGMNIIEISELYSDTIKISGAAQVEMAAVGDSTVAAAFSGLRSRLHTHLPLLRGPPVTT